MSPVPQGGDERREAGREAQRFAMVFRAAADGVMDSYFNSSGGWAMSDYTRDRAVAGAFRAVGDLFAKIAEAERASPLSSSATKEKENA